jgi:hypothetical protein
VPIDRIDPADTPDSPHSRDSPRRPDVIQPSPDSADREAAYLAYRAQVNHANAAHHDNPPADAASSPWAEKVPQFRAEWAEHKDQYQERVRETSKLLSPDQNSAVDRGYARACEIGEKDIVPGLLAVETEDPARHLAGFDHRIKGEDRLKEKVTDRMRTKGQPPEEALAGIPDVVRFTFKYNETTYTVGVQNDVKRLEDRGFSKVELRNTWVSEQYKGINTRWREPQSGMLFEVQFHTQASLEAKELTHEAYERIRSTAHDGERVKLKEFQSRVNSMIPIPPDIAEIEDYPPGDT